MWISWFTGSFSLCINKIEWPHREVAKEQVKNFLTVTLLVQGLPMVLMGDEVPRAHKEATTTLIVTTMKPAGSFGTCSKSTQTSIDS